VKAGDGWPVRGGSAQGVAPAARAALFAAWLGLVVGAPALRAQEAPPDTAEALTLAEALAVAARESPALEQARGAVSRAAADRLEGVGRLLPSLNATSGFSTTRVRRFTTTDVFGDPAAREEAVTATTRGSTQGLGLSATLFDQGESIAAARAAGARRAAAEAALEARWSELRAEVARAYVTLLERREAIEVERALLDARAGDVERTEALFRVVAADEIDVLGARIEARRQEAQLAAAEEAAQRAELELGRAMGIDGPADVRLVEPLAPFDPDSLDGEALVDLAREAHPEVRRLAAELEAARREENAEGWVAWLPRVDARASYDRSEYGGADAPFFVLDPRDTAWSFGLSLTLPVFDRFSRQAERSRARASVRSAGAALRERDLAVQAGVRTRWLELRNAWRQLVLEEATVEMARERARLAREKYQIAALDFTRLQQALDQATAAERALVQRRFDWHRALVELERAVGRPVALPDPGPD